MQDPVVDYEGNTFERRAITEWLGRHASSPVTRSPLTLERLAPNRALKEAIDAWKAANQGKVVDKVVPKPLQGSIKVEVQAFDRGATHDVIVTIDAGQGRQRTPVDIVCVIDISGSMQDEATTTSDKGDKEKHGLSLLDITKHAVSTVINSLGPEDRLALVSYSDKAREELALTAMNVAGQKRADTILKALHTEGSTNLWDGLLKGMDVLGAKPREGRTPAVFLLTDGQPNVEPPRGHLQMLQRYKEDHKVNYIINTFGFGYNLNSKLLDELATEGGGAYAFIPEATFVGTCFVNAMSNILVTAATDVTLSLENVNGATVASVLGGHPVKSASWGLAANLGSIQFGQKRTIAFSMTVPAGNQPFANVALQYADRLGEVARVEAVGTQRAPADTTSLGHWARGLASSAITTAISMVDKSGLNAAHAHVASVSKSIHGTIKAPDAATVALLKDLDGQVLEALSKQEFFKKWGRHYLPSLCRAHQLQQCNNFKDPGVQVYGGDLFQSLRDIADAVFLKLPPPTPSIVKNDGTKHAPIANMNVYYNSGAVCFTGDSVALMADGSVKRCDEIVAGDRVWGGFDVRCVVKTVCVGGTQPLVRLNPLLGITPWHPIYNAGKWTFPVHVAETKVEKCAAVYNFLLHSGHIMTIGGVQCATLAHGAKGDVREHEYWGSERVVEDLKALAGWRAGYVVIENPTIIRDQVTGLVARLVEGKVARVY